MRDLDPSQYGEADRREVKPPIEAESASWSAAGVLDYWVGERYEWWRRVRGPDRGEGMCLRPSTVQSPTGRLTEKQRYRYITSCGNIAALRLGRPQCRRTLGGRLSLLV